MRRNVLVLVTIRVRRLAWALLGAVVLLLWANLSLAPTSIDSQSLVNRIVVVDPGHGGRDSGSRYGQYLEKDIVLSVSKTLSSALQAEGATVVMTRETDIDLMDKISIEEEIEYSVKEYERDQQLEISTNPRDRGVALGTRQPPLYRLGLRARLVIAAKNNADILISIHTNRFGSTAAQGSMVIYQEHCSDSHRLGSAIQDHLEPLLGGRGEPDVIADDFFLLRRSAMPAVIVEVGFISNPRDREMMLSAEGRQKIAEAITIGIMSYFAAAH